MGGVWPFSGGLRYVRVWRNTCKEEDESSSTGCVSQQQLGELFHDDSVCYGL